MIRNKVYSLINIAGLAIGISASLIIFLIVHYHFSFDQFEPDRDRLYRVVSDIKSGGMQMFNQGSPSPLAAAVGTELSGVEETIGFHEWQNAPIVSIPRSSKTNKSVFRYQDNIVLVDPSYFRMVPYDWIAGSPNSLNDPYKVVLTEERAKAYFPGQPLSSLPGKTIYYDDTLALTVTGVVSALSKKSDFIYKEFVSQSTIVASRKQDYYAMSEWGSTNSATQLFVKLNRGNSKIKMEAQLRKLLNKHMPDAEKNPDNRTLLLLQPFIDMHFGTDFSPMQSPEPGHKPTLYGLTAVSIFLLLLACINFINLNTAQASQRAREIGVRKTMGSSRRQLVFQFLNETLLLSTAATIVSIVLTPFLLKMFADFIPPGLTFNLVKQPELIGFLFATIVVVSLLSGMYPALVLSGFNPILVLKNQAFSGSSGSRKSWLRKGLTISQFFVAQVFVMATLVMVKQIHFMINKDMGFKKEALITMSVPVTFTAEGYSKTDKRRFVVLAKLKSIPGIRRISLGSGEPASNSFRSNLLKFNDGKRENSIDVLMKFGDTNYLPMYHINLLAGRNVEPSDTIKEYVINETLMHALGFQKPQQAINKQLGGKQIVGVIADYNQTSLHAPIRSLAFAANANESWDFSVELNPQPTGAQSWKTTIDKIEAIFKSTYPQDDFRVEFFDENIAKFYQSEQNISRLLKWATGLAIFISCIGLLGLVLFTTRQRTKEIGVRKVLGASVIQIVSLLSRDLIWLVLIAFAVATPVAWYAMNWWLSDFAYRTPQSWWIFGISGVALLLIAMITLSIQTVRAASANPVKSLRTE